MHNIHHNVWNPEAAFPKLPLLRCIQFTIKQIRQKKWKILHLKM